MKKIKINCGDCILDYCNVCVNYRNDILIKDHFAWTADATSIEGIVDQLLSHSSNLRGYPMNKVTIYHVECGKTHHLLNKKDYTRIYRDFSLDNIFFEFKNRCVEIEVKPFNSQKVTLNFRTAGKILKSKTQIVKDELAKGKYKVKKGIYLFDCGESLDKAHINVEKKRFKVVVDTSITEETEELWEAIKFKKKVKEVLTEEWKYDLGYLPEDSKQETTQGRYFAPRIRINLLDERWLKGMKEKTYQALEKYVGQVFLGTPILVDFPTREQLNKINY